MSEPLVQTDWLADRLGQPNLRIVDCRYYFEDPPRSRREYLAAHIPGAAHLEWTRDISEPQGELLTSAPSPEHLREAMLRFGIGDDTQVVGYDDEGGHYVSRLWLILRRYGHDNVQILEGGWTKWLREGRPTASGERRRPVPTTEFTPTDGPPVLVDADTVLAHEADPDSILLDVRRWTEFTGEEVRARRGGRIPWARWMFWQDNLNWAGDRTFRSEADIRQRYTDAGVTPDKHIIVYCQSGVRAAHTAFTLARLGYPNVQVYDGSWEEWGNREDLPIAQGEP